MEGIEIKGLCKRFDGFSLEDVNITIPQGYVTGIIGNNGAGKTTLLKCITGSNVIDSGTIEFPIPLRMGSFGLVYDEVPFLQDMKVKRIEKIMKDLFPNWNSTKYNAYISSFGIESGKKIKELSRGMRMKLQVSIALSHDADYLILDEPTAGMDPAAREEFLDIVREFIQDEKKTVIISSHITSDLESVADFIIYLKDGKIVLSGNKDDIMDSYGIVRCDDAGKIGKEYAVARRKNEFSTDVLVRNRKAFSSEHPDMDVEPADLEDIMVYTIRGEKE